MRFVLINKETKDIVGKFNTIREAMQVGRLGDFDFKIWDTLENRILLSMEV